MMSIVKRVTNQLYNKVVFDRVMVKKSISDIYARAGEPLAASSIRGRRTKRGGGRLTDAVEGMLVRFFSLRLPVGR